MTFRDWSGLPGYISMRERPMRMKRDDWESLQHRLSPGRLNATLRSRRHRFLASKHYPLFFTKGPWLPGQWRRTLARIIGVERYSSECL